ncbi:MAG: signal peptidase II [Oscillospiraceae bacterium]|nr:signal peptidase II [Oscillospiraceae bacterium]
MILITLALAAFLIILDQITKLLIVKNFDIGEIKEIISIGSQKIFSITHVRNSGAAWSIMEGKTIILIIFPIIIVGIILFLLFKGKINGKLECISYSLIIAGGIGNLIDRIRLNEVIDFIKWEVFSFPVFNVADICIVVGAIMACVCYIFFSEDNSKDKKEAVTAVSGDSDKTENTDE